MTLPKPALYLLMVALVASLVVNAFCIVRVNSLSSHVVEYEERARRSAQEAEQHEMQSKESAQSADMHEAEAKTSSDKARQSAAEAEVYEQQAKQSANQ